MKVDRELQRFMVMLNWLMTMQYCAPPSLTFKLDSNVAYYDKGGFMTDQTTGDTLISDIGTYYGNEKRIVFQGNVFYRSEDYTIHSDWMAYNTEEGKVYFDGPTTIVSEENTIYCENGWYDTRNDISSFWGNAKIISDAQEITGDSLYYDRISGLGEVYGNMVMLDTAEDVQVSGGFGRYNEKDGTYEVVDRPIFQQFNKDDTLMLIADTLFAKNDTVNDQSWIQAYRNVRFMQGTMSGKCDSLIYAEADSILNMFYDPVLWQDSSQLSGDTIYIRTYDGSIKNLKLRDKAFIVSMDDSTQFNQISGKNMLGTFKENKLKRVYVKGNGRTVYYARNDKDNLVGMDYSLCSDIRIQMDDDQIEKIVFLTEPESIMYPIPQIPEDKRTLPNFRNRFTEVKEIELEIIERLP